MNISNTETPQDQMSVLRDSGCRLACSGEQYAGVIPSPKSLTFAMPSGVIITLAGFTSW